MIKIIKSILLGFNSNNLLMNLRLCKQWTSILWIAHDAQWTDDTIELELKDF